MKKDVVEDVVEVTISKMETRQRCCEMEAFDEEATGVTKL